VAWAAAAVAALAYVAGIGSADSGVWRVVAKPVPVLVMGGLVLSARRSGYAQAIAAGLGLSAVGDVLLEQPRGFVPGLIAFLLAHVAYTIAFASDERRLRLVRAVPLAAWLLAAFLWLRPGLGAMTLPVVVYMLAIGTMMWRAAARVDSTARLTSSEWAALAGAILFGLSDTLIAIDRFRAPVPGARYAIILLYWAGQAGIAASALARRPRARPA